MKTMIALVSDQRMQNVIPILQENASYDNLVLVMSKVRDTGQPLEKYIQSAGDLKAVLENHVKVELSDKYVDPFDIEDVSQKIALLIEKYKDKGKGQVVLNMSGGTKPMAIGALQAAQAAGIDSLYTNTGDGEIIWLSSDGSVRTEKINVCKNINIKLYIQAYGEQVDQTKLINAKNIDSTQVKWVNTIADNYKIIYKKIIVPVTTGIKESRKNGKGYPIFVSVSPTKRQRVVIEKLATQGLWECISDKKEIKIIIKSRVEADFLNGGWVEIYVAHKMYSSGFFNDVQLNVELEGVDGEIDVVAVSNGKLVLVECKSNVQRTEQLSKLDSSRQRVGGTFAQAYYARASDAYHKQIGKQCKKWRLDGVFFGEKLRDIGAEIGKKIGATS